jgi:hypothetical protein
MASYSEAATLYADEAFKGRAGAAIAEQAAVTYIGQEGTPESRLASGVIAGNEIDVDALTRQVTVAPTAGDKATNDADLLAAVQHAWPLVANARYKVA